MNKNYIFFIISIFFVAAGQYFNIFISKYTGIFPIISISGGIICWLYFKRGFKQATIASLVGIIAANTFFGHNYLYINIFYSSNNIFVPAFIYIFLKKDYKNNQIVNSTNSLILFFTSTAIYSLLFTIAESLYLYFIVKIYFIDILTISLGSFLSVFIGIAFLTPLLIIMGRDIRNLDFIKFIEFSITSVFIIFIFWLVFFNHYQKITTDILVFLFIPMTIIVTFRSSPSFLSVVLISIVFIAVKSTILNKSSFSDYHHYNSMIIIQFFFTLSYITTVLMKSLIIEKDTALKEIKKLNTNLETKVFKRTEKLNKALLKLKNTKRIYKNIFDNAGDGIFRVDSNGDFLNINNAAAEILGYSSTREIMNLIKEKKFKLFADKKKKKELISKIESSNKTIRFEFEVFKKDNEKIWVQTILSKEDNLSSTFIIEGIIRDITKDKLLSEKLKKKAFIDPLTQIYNREALYEKINEKIKINKNFSLFFMDMDGFKKVNDELGHNSGDQILKIITKRILKSVREDDIVARFGGDEFILLINDMDNIENIKNFSNQIINKLSSPYKLENGIYRLGVSIGISRFPYDSDNLNHLISKADQAMYISKKNGKNRWTLYKRENNEGT